MKPEHGPRRLIIREWMLQPKDKRQSKEQAEAFAGKAAEKHVFKCSGDRTQRILAWLLPRTGRA
jgi:hypothetical protein